MNKEMKSALYSASMVLLASIVLIIGVVVSTVINPIAGMMIGLGGFITWSWACFAKNKSWS